MLFKTVNGQQEFHPRVLGFIKHDDDKLIPHLQDVIIRDAVDSSGTTLLHLAARYCCDQLTVYVNRSKACHIDAQDHSGATPLMLAVQHQHLKQVELLLNFKANIHLKTKSGDSALKIALKHCHIRTGYIIMTLILKKLAQRKNHQEVVQTLKDADCPLYQAVYANNPEIIAMYIESGVPVNMQNDNNGNTALHMAAMLNDPPMIDMLLEKGADASIANTCDGYTPFILSLQQTTSKDIKEIKLLCDNVKSWTDRGSDGKLMLHPIFARGARHTLKLFVKTYAIDLNAKDLHGMTPLHYLAEHEDTEAIEVVKNFEFDLNAQDESGRTPLHIAVLRAATDIMEFLLKNGANANVKDNEGRTPLFYAFLDTAEEVDYHDGMTLIGILLQNGADPQVLTADEKTIINVGLKDQESHLLEPVVAHLAMTEVLGKPINDSIQNQINADFSLKKHYKSCGCQLQNMMEQVIFGSVTLFNILTGDDAKLEEYALKPKNADAIFGASREKVTDRHYRFILRKKLDKVAEFSGMTDFFEERKKRFRDQITQELLRSLNM